MAEFRAPFVPDLPRFTGGAVGYLDYDAAEWFEPAVARPGREPRGATDGIDDEAGFMVFDTVLAFDHVKHRILAIANARVRPGEDLRALYDFACAKIEFLERELERNLSQAPPAGVVRRRRSGQHHARGVRGRRPDASRKTSRPATSTRPCCRSASRCDVDAPPFDVYRALRHVNPSPYMFFIRMGGDAIVGASPEMLVRVEGRHVETHPIAGTRRRGRDARRKISGWPKSCGATRRSAPST